eukprot:TRINITY_DN12002_c1_g6_i1.p1 TRINITY_DN12002_c1_g6~~TRINITY_DN12002_c1_g6_i1.p1  ORF type:complete len:1435 (+),score=448.17 TRINITY_DN12002_c1_g6_i1:220-4305(+)
MDADNQLDPAADIRDAADNHDKKKARMPAAQERQRTRLAIQDEEEEDDDDDEQEDESEDVIDDSDDTSDNNDNDEDVDIQLAGKSKAKAGKQRRPSTSVSRRTSGKLIIEPDVNDLDADNYADDGGGAHEEADPWRAAEAELPVRQPPSSSTDKNRRAGPAQARRTSTSALTSSATHRSNSNDKVLYEWWLRLISTGVLICGYMDANDQAEVWRSSRIVKRIQARVLETQSGTRYMLEGEINLAACVDQGVPLDVAQAFERCNNAKGGFPGNWRSLIDAACLERKMQRAQQLLPASLQHVDPNVNVFADDDNVRRPAAKATKTLTPRRKSDANRSAASSKLTSKPSADKSRTPKSKRTSNSTTPSRSKTTPSRSQAKNKGQASSNQTMDRSEDAPANATLSKANNKNPTHASIKKSKSKAGSTSTATAAGSTNRTGKGKMTPSASPAPKSKPQSGKKRTSTATTPRNRTSTSTRRSSTTPQAAVPAEQTPVTISRSSRGRVRKPPMNFWEGQRLKHNGRGEVIGAEGLDLKNPQSEQERLMAAIAEQAKRDVRRGKRQARLVSSQGDSKPKRGKGKIKGGSDKNDNGDSNDDDENDDQNDDDESNDGGSASDQDKGDSTDNDDNTGGNAHGPQPDGAADDHDNDDNHDNSHGQPKSPNAKRSSSTRTRTTTKRGRKRDGFEQSPPADELLDASTDDNLEPEFEDNAVDMDDHDDEGEAHSDGNDDSNARRDVDETTSKHRLTAQSPATPSSSHLEIDELTTTPAIPPAPSSGGSDPTKLSKYERERQARITDNLRMLHQLGLQPKSTGQPKRSLSGDDRRVRPALLGTAEPDELLLDTPARDEDDKLHQDATSTGLEDHYHAKDDAALGQDDTSNCRQADSGPTDGDVAPEAPDGRNGASSPEAEMADKEETAGMDEFDALLAEASNNKGQVQGQPHDRQAGSRTSGKVSMQAADLPDSDDGHVKDGEDESDSPPLPRTTRSRARQSGTKDASRTALVKPRRSKRTRQAANASRSTGQAASGRRSDGSGSESEHHDGVEPPPRRSKRTSARPTESSDSPQADAHEAERKGCTADQKSQAGQADTNDHVADDHGNDENADKKEAGPRRSKRTSRKPQTYVSASSSPRKRITSQSAGDHNEINDKNDKDEASSDEQEEDDWSADEVALLRKALLRPGLSIADASYWHRVAAVVKTKSAKECVERYMGMPDQGHSVPRRSKPARKGALAAALLGSASAQKAAIARQVLTTNPNTMLHRKAVRAGLKLKNQSHQDDAFEGQPTSIKVKLPEIADFDTPTMPSLTPLSTTTTPASSNVNSPGLLTKPIDRDELEPVLNRALKRQGRLGGKRNRRPTRPSRLSSVAK